MSLLAAQVLVGRAAWLTAQAVSALDEARRTYDSHPLRVARESAGLAYRECAHLADQLDVPKEAQE